MFWTSFVLLSLLWYLTDKAGRIQCLWIFKRIWSLKPLGFHTMWPDSRWLLSQKFFTLLDPLLENTTQNAFTRIIVCDSLTKIKKVVFHNRVLESCSVRCLSDCNIITTLKLALYVQVYHRDLWYYFLTTFSTPCLSRLFKMSHT